MGWGGGEVEEAREEVEEAGERSGEEGDTWGLVSRWRFRGELWYWAAGNMEGFTRLLSFLSLGGGSMVSALYNTRNGFLFLCDLTLQ